MIDLLASTGNFALYFGSAIALLFLFKIIYAFVTPHNKWQLIKEQQNMSAAISFGGTHRVAAKVYGSDFKAKPTASRTLFRGGFGKSVATRIDVGFGTRQLDP